MAILLVPRPTVRALLAVSRSFAGSPRDSEASCDCDDVAVDGGVEGVAVQVHP